MTWLEEREPMTPRRFWEMLLLTVGAVVLAFAITAFIGVAKAQNAQEVSIGYGLYCDTVEEVTYYINLDNEDREEGLKETNEHFGGTKACGLKFIAFREDDDGSKKHEKDKVVIKSPKGKTIYIIPIVVYGFFVGDDYHSITPSLQYSPFTDEKETTGHDI